MSKRKQSTLIPKEAQERTNDPQYAKSLQNIKAHYTHADLRQGLWYVPSARKNLVVIKCRKRGCNNQRAVYTSDLHQVRTCTDCRAKGGK